MKWSYCEKLGSSLNLHAYSCSNDVMISSLSEATFLRVRTDQRLRELYVQVHDTYSGGTTKISSERRVGLELPVESLSALARGPFQTSLRGWNYVEMSRCS